MKAKSHKNINSSHPAKENCPVSGNNPNSTFTNLEHLKLLSRIRNGQHVQPTQKALSFDEVRRMCIKQERQVLCEVKSTNLEHTFYQFCESELKGLKIFNQIQRIKNLSDDEAIEEFNSAWCKKDQEKGVYYRDEEYEQEYSQIFVKKMPHKFSIMEEEEPQLPEIQNQAYQHYQDIQSESRQWGLCQQDRNHEVEFPIFVQNDIFEF